MARYFFNIRHGTGAGSLALDPDGDEISDKASVRDFALAAARDLRERTRLDSIPNWFDCSFEVTDEQGRLVISVPFTETVSTDEQDDP